MAGSLFVDEEDDGGTLTALCGPPSREPIYPPMNQYQDNESGHQDSTERANVSAAYANVVMRRDGWAGTVVAQSRPDGACTWREVL
jgi:hypothetical protein